MASRGPGPQGSLHPSTEPSSFPNPTDITEHRPVSRESRLTDDEMTDYGDPVPPVTAPQPTPTTVRTPVQSAAPRTDDFSRPSSPATSLVSRGNWSQTTPQQRQVPGSNAGSTGAASTRPPTSHSRTHVPSLTAQAFYRPMSSQRLQAQRGQRQSLPGSQAQGQESRKDGEEKTTEGRQVASPRRPGSTRRLSHGTEMTELGPTEEVPEVPALPDFVDRGSANASPGGESETALQPSGGEGIPARVPGHLNLSRSKDANVPPGPTSPRSFRSTMIPSRHSKMSLQGRQGHEKLPSDASTAKARQATKDIVKQNLGRNYEYFPGNTVFCLGGRLQNAKDRPINIGTGILLLLPIVLFYAFSAVWLWKNVSPAIPIVFGYLSLICFSSFWHGSVSDPGILPRNLHPFPPAPPNEDPLTPGPPNVKWTLVKSSGPIDAMEVPTKFCKTCDIWRSPRTHHCRTCDNCVETQDHHCVWLNNCVGRRNYRYFFAFVSSASLLGAFLIGASLTHILVYQHQNHLSFTGSIAVNRVPFALVFYALLGMMYPVALWGYHLWLIARGETTREYMQSQKFAPRDRHRPYTQGNFVKNWISVLLRPRPPTYLRFKSPREAGDRRFAEVRRAEKRKEGKEVEMRAVGRR